MAADAVPAEVTITDTHIHLDKFLVTHKLWGEVTNVKEIEQLIIARNRKHL